MADVAEFVLSRLTEWGVHRIYGYPGDGINGFLGAFDRADGDPEFVQVRHEETAALAACGHAKYTGTVGCCIATSGPGAIHLLNGLYDAKLDHQPVVAIVGQQRRIALGGHYQQEVDLASLFKDVAGEYVQTCMEPAQARHLVDRAVRIALDRRAVTCLIFPNDVQEMDAQDSPPRQHGAVYSTVGHLPPRVVPYEENLRLAADILNAGTKVAMLVGQGAGGASDEVLEAAELLGAGVAKALLGKTVLADDLPFVTGPIGLLGSRPSYEMMESCDTLLMVGTSFPYAEWLPKEGQARGVQIDIDGRMLGIRYAPIDVPLVGDARETLRALIPYLRYKEDRAWRRAIERDVAAWWRLMEERALADANPINPQRVVWELNGCLPDEAIIAGDSGSSTNWLARLLRVRPGMLVSLSGTLATMGSAVPYAIAAKFAHPDRPVIGLLGDGAFTMNGMNELVTIAKYRHRWSDPRLVLCVFNNQDLNQVTWEQRALAGDPKYMGSQHIPDFPAARYAELVGLGGIKVDDPADVGPAWERALAADRPYVIEAVVDPEIAPLPPHVSVEQMSNLGLAVLKGDPEGFGVLRKSLRDKVRELLPGR